MIIRNLSATFGKLDRQNLSLKEGLNIIEAPNESGKSTWCAFLRAMLYGIDTKARDKKGVIAEKNLYQPWNGSLMEGSMDVEHQGHTITLRRTGKAGAPLSQFQAVYTGTEESVPGLSSDNVGEYLTGVGREVFERSAFVGQSGLAISGSAELERRIAAIVSSGQEDISYSETEQRLRDWKNRRQSNQKNGIIPRLEAERSQVAATLERLESANRQAGDARKRIAQLELERAQLETQAAAHRALSAAQQKSRYDAAKTELEASQTALDEVQQELKRRGDPPQEATLRALQGDLAYLSTLDANIKQARRECDEAGVMPELPEHPIFSGMDLEGIKARATADAQALKKFQETPGGSLPWSSRIAIIAALFVAGAGVVLVDLLDWRPLLAGLWCAACALFIAFIIVRGMVKRWKALKQADQIIKNYGEHDPVAIVRQAKQFLADRKAAEEAQTQFTKRTIVLEQLQADRVILEQRLLDTTHTFAPEVTDLFGVSAAVSLALNLDEKQRRCSQRLESARKVFQAVSVQGIPEELPMPECAPALSEDEVERRLRLVTAELSRQNETLAMAQGQMNSLGDSAALTAQLGQLDAALAARREEHRALQIAMDALEEANAQLQTRMSPALNECSGELFARLTGNQYDRVSLTREFDMLAQRPGDVTPRKLLTLSKGTADQLYLAVRLAVCDLVLSADTAAPLVLDDALVAFDDERLELALDLLRELAKERQILLFTCQSRERQYLGGVDGVHMTHL